MKRYLAFAPLSLCLMAFECQPPQSPGQNIVYRDVEKQVPMPCPVTEPKRPDPLPKPLPSDLGALVDVLTGKLLEYAGPGKYADQAQSALDICIHPVMIGHPSAVVNH